MQNQFISLPDYKPLDDGVNWISTKRMKYIDPWGKQIAVPIGFKSDFASIPDLSRIALMVQLASGFCFEFFWPWFFGSIFVLACVVIFIAEEFLHEGTWDAQAFLHDYMFRTRCRSFWKANWILFLSMNAKGAAKTPLWKRWLIFGGVAIGGYFAWIDDKKNLPSSHRLAERNQRRANLIASQAQ
jgi:hypothetical protein